MLRGAFRLFNTSAKFEFPFKLLWGGNVKQNVTSNIDIRVPFISDRNTLAAAHYPVENLQRTLHKATSRQTFRYFAHTPTPSSSFGIPSAFSTSLLEAARKLTLPQGSRAENISQLTSHLTKAPWAAARQSPPVSREPRGSQAIARSSRRLYTTEPTRKAKGTTEWQGNSFAYVASKKESWWSRIKRHLSVMGSGIASIGRVPLVPLLLGIGGAVPFIALSPPVSPHVPLPLSQALVWRRLVYSHYGKQWTAVDLWCPPLLVLIAHRSTWQLLVGYFPMRVLLTVVAMTSLGATWAFSSTSGIVSVLKPTIDSSKRPK